MDIADLWIAVKKFNRTPGEKRRAEHEAGLELLHQGLLERYGIGGSPVIEKGPHGKPYLADYPDIYFNISHCDGLAACVIGACPVGIDLERIRPFTDKLLLKVLTQKEIRQVEEADSEEEREKMFFRFWTLKESYVKAVGCGITVPLTTVEFELEDLDNGCVHCSAPEYLFWQKTLPEANDCIMAVCAAFAGRL